MRGKMNTKKPLMDVLEAEPKVRKSKKVGMTFTIDSNIAERLNSVCRTKNWNKSQIIERLLQEFLEKKI